MKISTRFLLNISIIFFGYIVTVVVSYCLGYVFQQQVNQAASSLFPAIIESRKALTAFDNAQKAYESLVVLGEESLLDEAKKEGAISVQALSKVLGFSEIPDELRPKALLLKESVAVFNVQAQEIYPLFAKVDLDIDPEIVEKAAALAESRREIMAELGELVSVLTNSLADSHNQIVHVAKLQGHSNLILFCLVLIFSAIAVTSLVRKIVGPIQTLAETANLIQAGELNRKADVTGNDEIGKLADAFNSMTQKLRKSVTSLEAEVVERKLAQEELARHRDNLEELVVERTEELKQANVALQAAEAKIRSLIEHLPDYIINIDQNYKINYVNKPLAGYAMASRSGTSVLDVISPEYKDRFRDAVRKAFETGKGGMLTTEIKTPDGKGYWYENRFAAITDEEREVVNEVMLIATDITQRKLAEEELEDANKRLIDNAHKAGMADIAAGTIHNVGNILNSLKTSLFVIRDITAHSNLRGFKKANDLLRKNVENIKDFITNDPKGEKLMQYYLRIESEIDQEQEDLQSHLERLSDKVSAIEEVIVAQQNYAGASALIEEYSLAEIIEDALKIQSGTIARYHIRIIKQYGDVPKMPIQKTKLVHIMINLIKNAKEAMIDVPPEKRIIKLILEKDQDAAYIKVVDNGYGIAQERLTNIFIHGYTTKKEGHGFGLHSSANYMAEMGGVLRAESEGEGKGATFILMFPFKKNIVQ